MGYRSTMVVVMNRVTFYRSIADSGKLVVGPYCRAVGSGGRCGGKEGVRAIS